MYVFAYGTLKKGKYNHHFMNGYEEFANSSVNGFKMFSNGYFPCAIKGKKENKIFGEIYLFKKNQINIS